MSKASFKRITVPIARRRMRYTNAKRDASLCLMAGLSFSQDADLLLNDPPLSLEYWYTDGYTQGSRLVWETT